MTTALLADDEPLLREHLREKLLALWPDLDIVAEASNGNEAAAMLAAHEPDVAFLDIKMPGQTGIEVAQGTEAGTRIVFVTAYDQYAVQAFENEAIDYLLKPVTNDRLAQTVARLKAALAQSAPAPDMSQILNLLSRAASGTGTDGASGARPQHLRWIRASRGDTTYQISVDEVLFFQSDDKYTIVNTANGEHVIRMPLAELLQSLDGEQFWQVHRSTVVNIRCVTSSKRDGDGKVTLNLKGYARPLPVSRAYQGLFKQM
jgi:DNA-binding LytR/AlgR family response regulator